MILSDRSIREALEKKDIAITPFDDSLIQPASVDVRLASSFLLFKNFNVPYIDVKKKSEDLYEKAIATDDKPFILHPGEFVLGSVEEFIELSSKITARLEGKSSLARLGLLIHSTAGFIDPGFKGNITLELSNVSRLPITLYPHMKIGHISFSLLTTPAEKPYGSKGLDSKYQGNEGPKPSRFYKNF